MLKKVTVLLISVVVLVSLSYYWGYLCGKRDASLGFYDYLLLNLTNYILVHDAIKSGQTESMRPLVDSQIETSFAYAIGLYEDYNFEYGEYSRCTVSKRIRKMKKNGLILSDKNRMQDYPLKRVEGYLVTECLGEPSHGNWAVER